MRLRVIVLVLCVRLACGDEDDGSEEAETPRPSKVEAKGKKIVDRLAMNLAGAFVNSLFPQVSKAKEKLERKAEQPEAMDSPIPMSPDSDNILPEQREIRRAPVSPLSNPQTLSVPFGAQYNPRELAAQYNALPQDPNVSPLQPLAFQQRPRYAYQATQQHLPSEYLYQEQSPQAPPPPVPSPRDPFDDIPPQYSSNVRRAPAIGGGSYGANSGPFMEALMPQTASMLAGDSTSPGNIQGINAVRNQQYLAQLAKHQNELSVYNQKQLEYLDQQRRYQQAMIDHQAGAALLMQQQQQQLLEEQIQKAKELQQNPFTAMGESAKSAPDNTVGGRLLTQDNEGDDVRRRSEGYKRTYTEDDMVITDENLKAYFKEQYGIDIPEDGTSLTDDERETLQLLKKELQSRKEEAVSKGTFKTMDKIKGKIRRESEDEDLIGHYSSSSSSMSSLTDDDFRRSSKKSHKCPRCLPVKLKQIKGSWTQVYGNPQSLRKTFSTIMSLEEMDGDTDSKTLSLTSKKPICVGMEVSSAHSDKAALNVFFRDDGGRKKLHEMRGDVYRQGDDSLLLSTDMYNSQACVLKVGPAEVSRYEYMVIGEMGGTKPCSALHVFVRNIDEFFNRFYDDFADFMKTKIDKGSALPVAKLPESSLCQLN